MIFVCFASSNELFLRTGVKEIKGLYETSHSARQVIDG